ncbi:MAG: PIN domain-containing protein [Defluviitaleaceae bacterium]|nr:PIN domain-containing protein [Defluviitaleaceae bacterium]
MILTYTLDTNTISYLLRGEGNVEKHYINEIIEYGNNYTIPGIVYYEIERWLRYKPTKMTRSFAQFFINLYNNVRDKSEITHGIWEKAIEIYIELKQKGQLIGDADILIAAYCVVNGYTLVTNNTNDFIRINGIKLTNWLT